MQSLRRYRERLLIAACLSLPLAALGFVAVDGVTRDRISGSAIVEIEMETCRNPEIRIAGERWLNYGGLPQADWSEGDTLQARFTWSGDRGVLHAPNGAVDYHRMVEGRFYALECQLS